MRTILFLPLLWLMAPQAFATEGSQRLDNRSLRANFRVFIDSDQFSRNQVTITEHGEQTSRFFDSCPEQVQIGGVRVDSDSKGLFSNIESNTYISDSNISVFCE